MYFTSLDYDRILHEIITSGFAILPEIPEIAFDFKSVKVGFTENHQAHLAVLDSLGGVAVLARELERFAVSEFGFRDLPSDHYHVTRRVDGCIRGEAYKTHFDSHLFTLVLPLRLPEASCFGEEEAGQLFLLPGARQHPSNALVDALGKLAGLRFRGAKGVGELRKKTGFRVFDFKDRAPIIFAGNVCLHGNYPFITRDNTQTRVTGLSHFFDPFNGKGVGSMLRWLRKR